MTTSSINTIVQTGPGPFASAAELYIQAGWRGVIPLPAGAKGPPPTGFTGWAGAVPSWADIQSWLDDRPESNLALRLPADVIGIDIDLYDGKPGRTTIDAAKTTYGPLPLTWSSTSRDDGSGISLYRVRPGLAWPGELPGGGVELIHFGHRYAMAWPSLHPEGRAYRWISPEGVTVAMVPPARELPWLPERWQDGLSLGAHTDTPRALLGGLAADAWLSEHNGPASLMCSRMTNTLSEALADLASGGARHEAALKWTLSIVRLMEQCHIGGVDALGQFERAFISSVTSGSGQRTAAEAVAEWSRLLLGATGIVAGQPTWPRESSDPCAPIHPVESINAPSGQTVAPSAPDILTVPTAEQPDGYSHAVNLAALKLRVQADAKAIILAEHAATIVIPTLIGLGEFLAVPDEPVSYLIDNLWPTGGRVIMAAAYKAGKTTGVGNIIKSLADGQQFLGTFNVTPPTGQIVLLDTEMSESQHRRWLRALGIENQHKVRLISLRGKMAAANFLDPAIRSRWVTDLQAVGCSVLILDCLRPVLDAIGLSEDKDAGKFLVAFDTLLAEAGIGEALVVQHMGHLGERTRGDSRLRDWPDAEWKITRQAEGQQAAESNAPRFFSAFGRDVDVAEGAITFDPITRLLAYSEGSRQQARAASTTAAALPDVLKLLEQTSEELSGRAIGERLSSTTHSRESIRLAVELGVTTGAILRRPGPRNSWLHFLNPASAPVRGTAPTAHWLTGV